MTLDDIFKHGQEAAKHLFEVQGAIHPMWLAETESGQIFPICMDMPDRDKRDILSEALRATFRYHKVVRYVNFVEAWCVAMPAEAKSDLMENGYEGSLQDHPDRREAVMVQAEDINGEERTGQFFILRPESGKAKLSPFKVFDNAKHSEGRFTHLLNTED